MNRAADGVNGVNDRWRGQPVARCVCGGRVTGADSTAPDVRGTRAAIELIGRHPRLSGTAIQTVGSEGYDGGLRRLRPDARPAVTTAANRRNGHGPGARVTSRGRTPR